MTYGDFIKNHRIEARLTLREFCRKIGADPSNWSKVERGITPPPADERHIDRISQVLNLGADSIQQLNDLASIARGQIPSDLRQGEVMAKMPAFFRAIRGQEYDENDLREMIEEVRKFHQP